MSKIVGIKKINRIRKTSESIYIPSIISDPKITVISSSIATISADNEEIRCVGSNGTLSSLTVYFDNALTFTNLTKFSSSLVFKTSSNGCSFTMNPPTSISLKMTGDDVADGSFSPQPNKVYDIMFYWNGFYLNGIIKGTEVQNQITITNSGTRGVVTVLSDESLSTVLAEIEVGQSKDFFLDGNLIYAGCSSKYGTVIDGEPQGCTLTSMRTVDFYDPYKIEITNSPASCSLKSNF